MTDVATFIVAGACLIGFVLVVLAVTHPRRGPVPPVPRRAMRQYVDPFSGDRDAGDGIR